MTRQDEMEQVHEASPAAEPPGRSLDQPPRLAYVPPTIEDLGDVRSVVLGASVGTPDTGNPNFGLAQ